MERLARALESRAFPFVFIGGIAVAAWSRPRTTVDLDVLVAIESLEPSGVVVALEGEGFRLTRKGVHRDVMMAGFRVIRDYPEKGSMSVPVDVLISNNPVVHDIIQRACQRSVGSKKVRVPSAEDLIILKLQAGRLRDLADAQAVARAQKTSLDLEYLKKQADVFSVQEGLDRILTSS